MEVEFMVWWKDSVAMKFMVESFALVGDAFARVKELQMIDLEVLPVIRHKLEG